MKGKTDYLQSNQKEKKEKKGSHFEAEKIF